MTASVPRRGTSDFSLTSAAGPYMANSIHPFSAQCLAPPCYPQMYVQKLMQIINARLAAGWEVFRHLHETSHLTVLVLVTNGVSLSQTSQLY